MSEKLNYNPNDFVCNVPIEEKLRRVPEDAEWWVHQWSTSDHFEIGRICREAYNKLNEQQAEIEKYKIAVFAMECFRNALETSVRRTALESVWEALDNLEEQEK